MRAGSGSPGSKRVATELHERQVRSIRVLLLALFLALAFFLVMGLVQNGTMYIRRTSGVLIIFTMAVTALAHFRLRANRLSQAVWAVVAGSMLILVVETIAGGVVDPATRHLYAFAIPIAFAALLLGRAALWTTVILSIFVVLVAYELETTGVRWIARGQLTEVAIPVVFTLVMGLLGMVLDRFGLTLRQALDQVSAREQELSRLVERLEQEVEERRRTVREREALLERERVARARAEELAADNARLLDGNRRLNNELERRVQERTLELQLAIQELEMYAQSVAHDFRTPLRGIDGFSQVLLEDYADKLDATASDYIRRIRSGARRLGDLTDALNALSRLSRHPLNPTTVDLGAMAGRIIDQKRREQPEKLVDVRIAEELRVTADKTLLGIVLEALIDNSLKFAPRDRMICIEVGSTSEEGERIFFVRDNGVGFEMRYATKIFAPFQRLHHHEDYAGSGIGLSLAQRIIDRHGGRIWAQGEPGQGATVYFTLGPPGRGH